MKRIYFDNAASTPIDERVLEEITAVWREQFGNPSSIHSEGRSARMVVERARKTVAQIIGASIGELFFTSCGTESNNMVLKCAVRDQGVRRIISSRAEHPCVLRSLDRLASEGIEIMFVGILENGRADIEHLASLLQESTLKTLVTLMHANNETGAINDLSVIGALCKEHGALLHSDTVQTLGFLPIDVKTMGIDYLSGSAHKLYGPKGVGMVYINGDHQLKSFIEGGGQERNMRSGTENVGSIAGFAKALELAMEEQENRCAHVEKIHTYFKATLAERFAGLVFNVAKQSQHQYSKILSVSFPETEKSELLMLNLDIAGIAASGGSACSSGVETQSHVMKTIGNDPTFKTIRFSFSHHNTLEEVDKVIEVLVKQTGLPTLSNVAISL